MIRNYLRDAVLVRRALFVLACGLVGMALAAITAAGSTRIYEASATVLVASVTREDAAAGGGANPLTETNDAQQKVLTLAPLAISDVVIERVITTLRLDETPTSLRANMAAEAVPQTVLLRISARATNPQTAREIANTAALELDLYVQELNEESVGSASTTTARLVDPALLPEGAISPRPAIMLALGLIGGLAVGLVVMAGVARRDELLRTETKIQQVTGTSSLGAVPRVPGRELTPSDVAIHEQAHQSFKGMRINLVERLPSRTGSPVVAMISAESGEGKTSLTLGLARALAADGRTVLVVDGDPRQHALTTILGLEDQSGWVDAHEEADRPTDLALKDILVGVDVVPLGVQGSRGPDGQGVGRAEVKTLQQVITYLRSDYDIVLVDTADLTSYADSALISRHADGAVLVVPCGQIGPRQLTHAMNSVARAGGQVLGTVMNFAAPTALG